MTNTTLPAMDALVCVREVLRFRSIGIDAWTILQHIQEAERIEGLRFPTLDEVKAAMVVLVETTEAEWTETLGIPRIRLARAFNYASSPIYGDD